MSVDNFLEDGPDYDLGYFYIYHVANEGYVLGTNLERPPAGSSNNKCGNYQLRGGGGVPPICQ